MRTLAILLVLSGGVARAEAPDPAAVAKMSDSERRDALGKLSRDEQAKILSQLTPQQLVDIAKGAVAQLGTYEGDLTKQERVKGKILPQQSMHVQIREKPFAVRIEVTEGPTKGRKVVYNANLKPDQMRAKEGGMLGFVGGVWVDIDGSLAKGDTNHPVTDLGFANILKIIEGDIKLAQPAGGLNRVDEGFDANGLYCMHVTPPAGVKTYAAKSRLCFDPVQALPMQVEVEDGHGFLEKFRWKNVHPVKLGEDDFTPKAFGI